MKPVRPKRRLYVRICSFAAFYTGKNFENFPCKIDERNDLLDSYHFCRHHKILKAIDKDKSTNQETNAIRKAISNVNSVQTLNAIFQYCPQFLLQSFLIIYRENKSVLTGKTSIGRRSSAVVRTFR